MTAGTVTRITVGGAAPYDVVVGDRIVRDHLPELLSGVSRCAVVTAGSLAALATPAVEAAREHGVETELLSVPDGESAKAAPVVERLWSEFGRINLTRSDAVVAVGGGATTDLAGFAAATWLRGLRWIAVPTTLLGMVDAAVGGKTAINTDAGKNLVGAFHPPVGVLVDRAHCSSLPTAEWVNGLAEVLKAGMIADPVILDVVEADPADAARPDATAGRELVERAIAVKADVVGRDLREAGPREFLNYGHTLGHAIERVEGYRRPHGHAVAIGMAFAGALAVAGRRVDPAVITRQNALLQAVGLPTSYADPAAWPALREAMAHDKKARGATLRFVVLEGVARPAILADPAEEWLEAAWDAVCPS